MSTAKKGTAGVEDLFLGHGSRQETRFGASVPVTKINSSNIPYSGDTETGDMVSIKSKIDSEADNLVVLGEDIEVNKEALINISAANGTIASETSQFITPVQEVLPFKVNKASTDTSIFSFNAEANTILYGLASNFDFISKLHFSSTTNAEVTLTIKLIDTTSSAELMVQTILVNIPSGETDTLHLNSLVALAAENVTARIVISADILGLELTGFTSTLIAGLSGMLGNYYSKAESDIKHRYVPMRVKALGDLGKAKCIRGIDYNQGENATGVYTTAQQTTIAIGITALSVLTGEFVDIVTKGIIENIDTSAWEFGDILYSAGAGELTNIKPIGQYQAVAYVVKDHAVTGAIMVNIAEPRYREDIPSIPASRLLSGTIELDIVATHSEVDTSTTAHYVIGNIIQINDTGDFYTCIQDSGIGELLTSTSFFTLSRAKLLGTDLKIIYSDGYGDITEGCGAANSIEVLPGTNEIQLSYLQLQQGTNYLYKLYGAPGMHSYPVKPLFGVVSTDSHYYMDGDWYYGFGPSEGEKVSGTITFLSVVIICDSLVNIIKLEEFLVPKLPIEFFNAFITESGLADGAVTSSKIADGAVTSSKIADGSLEVSKFSDIGPTGSITIPPGEMWMPIGLPPQAPSEGRGWYIFSSSTAISLELLVGDVWHGAGTTVSGLVPMEYGKTRLFNTGSVEETIYYYRLV